MNDHDTACHTLDALILDEILIRAGLDQAHAPPPDQLDVAVNFSVRADSGRNCLNISCDHVGSSPVDIALQMGEPEPL